VTTPVLRLCAELSWNRASRIAFASSSPNGILLFRGLAAAVVAYAQAALATAPPPQEADASNGMSTNDPNGGGGAGGGSADAYATRYKGLYIALQTLHRALGGNYVNFGVFALYGDPALDNALGAALELSMTVAMPDVIGHPKLAREYYSLVETLSRSGVSHLARLTDAAFARVASSLESGIRTSLDGIILSKACDAVDALCGHRFSAGRRIERDRDAAAFCARFDASANIWVAILSLLLNQVLFEVSPNMYAASRPMLGLVLLHENEFAVFKQRIAEMYWGEAREKLGAAFDALMADVERNLEPRNRDKFTHNLSIFRHAATQAI
jgi:exportin-7